uniref:(California timema) hypothetical protein n=1 Tax=Timema californicum TaxID=61474 RepID=A0A7R9P5M7_TIMCA|nr:unnamed protein product [Timema californicum]
MGCSEPSFVYYDKFTTPESCKGDVSIVKIWGYSYHLQTANEMSASRKAGVHWNEIQPLVLTTTISMYIDHVSFQELSRAVAAVASPFMSHVARNCPWALAAVISLNCPWALAAVASPLSHVARNCPWALATVVSLYLDHIARDCTFTIAAVASPFMSHVARNCPWALAVVASPFLSHVARNCPWALATVVSLYLDHIARDCTLDHSSNHVARDCPWTLEAVASLFIDLVDRDCTWALAAVASPFISHVARDCPWALQAVASLFIDIVARDCPWALQAVANLFIDLVDRDCPWALQAVANLFIDFVDRDCPWSLQAVANLFIDLVDRNCPWALGAGLSLGTRSSGWPVHRPCCQESSLGSSNSGQSLIHIISGQYIHRPCCQKLSLGHWVPIRSGNVNQSLLESFLTLQSSSASVSISPAQHPDHVSSTLANAIVVLSSTAEDGEIEVRISLANALVVLSSTAEDGEIEVRISILLQKLIWSRSPDREEQYILALPHALYHTSPSPEGLDVKTGGLVRYLTTRPSSRCFRPTSGPPPGADGSDCPKPCEYVPKCVGSPHVTHCRVEPHSSRSHDERCCHSAAESGSETLRRDSVNQKHQVPLHGQV